MKTRLTFRFALLLTTMLMLNAVASGQTTQATPAYEEEPEVPKEWFEEDGGEALIDGCNEFGADLLEKLARNMSNVDNLVFSPPSMHLSLMMAREGADGATLRQMTKVLDVDATRDADPADYIDELLAALNVVGADQDGVELTVANALWGQSGEDWQAEFLEQLKTDFAAPMEDVDFTDDPEAARETINTWIAKKTGNQIAELLPEDSLDETTRMVLTNAVYFKASWKYTFDATKTAEEPFTLATDKTVDVQMMHQTGTFNYARGSTYSLLELPYTGEGLSMLVILPNHAGDLHRVCKGMNLSPTIRKFKSQEVAVSLPKFQLRSTLDPKSALEAMGMKDVFDPDRADFSAMTVEDNELYIDQVMHEGMIDVSETGTEAAAATAVVVNTRSARPAKTVEFVADRPFLFVIKHNETGLILMAGVISDPTDTVAAEAAAEAAKAEAEEKAKAEAEEKTKAEADGDAATFITIDADAE